MRKINLLQNYVYRLSFAHHKLCLSLLVLFFAAAQGAWAQYTVTFDGNGQTLAVLSLKQPTSGQAILLPAGYTASEDVSGGTWVNVSGNTADGPLTTSVTPTNGDYYESYSTSSTAANKNVLTQTVSGLDDNYYYEVVMDVAASYTSGRGWTCSTGDNLTVAFAGDKTVNIPVVDRQVVASGGESRVVFVVKPTSGNLTFGLRNIAASGNWFVAKLVSLKKITDSSTFIGWFTAASGGSYVGGAGSEYTPTESTTLYARWGNVNAVTSGSDYNRGKVMTNTDGTLSVTLGGWMFKADLNISSYGATDEKLGDSSKDWPGSSIKLEDSDKKATGFTYYLKGDTNNNPRNEFGNNSQPQSTAIYGSKMTLITSETCIDPMFNVPTSGSYLIFEPKTNGTVAATVYQNGVFNDTKNTQVYRPQRRVFVIDEAGTLIQSTPKLENTTGKFDFSGATKATTSSECQWDVDESVYATPEVLKAHFGVENCSSENSFTNGVYECLIDNNILHNEAVTQGATFPGARGWCVLIAAPVTYTFNVKAGKTYYLYNYGSKIGFYGFKFTETENTVDDISYIDTQTGANITATAAGHVANVSIDHKFNVGVWNAAVLPFSLNKQQVDAIFGHTYDKDNQSGTEILYFEKVEDNTAYYTRHAYNTIVAGKPFLIRPTGKLSASSTDVDVATASSDKKTISIDMSKITAFPYVTIENTTPAAWGRKADSADYYWTGDYNVQKIYVGDYYVNNEGTLLRREGSEAKIQAFRSYLKARTSGSAKMLSVGMTNLVGNDSDEVDIIEGLKMDEDGNLYNVPTSGKIYNIYGQMVSTDASSLYSLPAGLYVVNGKKYIVK